MIKFKFRNATNFELNSLMFPKYKNTQTGKALVGLSSKRGGIIFGDISMSISVSKLTERYGVVFLLEKEYKIMGYCDFQFKVFAL